MQGMWITNMIAQPDLGLPINLNTQTIPSSFVTLDSTQNYSLASGINYTPFTENQFASVQPISLPVLLQQQQLQQLQQLQQQQQQQQQQLASLTPLEIQQRQSWLRCRLCDSLAHTTEQCPQDFAKRTRSCDEEQAGNSSFTFKNQENQFSSMASAALVNGMSSYQDPINACNVINNVLSDNTNTIMSNNPTSNNMNKTVACTNNSNSRCNSFVSSGTTSINNSFCVASVSAAVPSMPPLPPPVPLPSSTSSSLVMSGNSLLTSSISKDYGNNDAVEPLPLMQLEPNNYNITINKTNNNHNNNHNNNMYNSSLTSNGAATAAPASAAGGGGGGRTTAASSSFSNSSSSLTAAPSSLPLSSPSQTQTQEKFNELSQPPLVPINASSQFTSGQPLFFTQTVRHHFTGQEVIVPSSINSNGNSPLPPPPLPLPIPMSSATTSPFATNVNNVNRTPPQHPLRSRGVCLMCGSTQHTREDCPQRMRKLECHQCHQLGHMMMHCPMTRCYNCGSYGHSSQVCHSKPHCFHCSHSGHRSMECPMRFKGRVCYQCNEPGHEAAHCPQGQLCRMCHRSGHLVAHCPAVTCHTCHVKGHTAGVCDKVKCDKCNLTHSPSSCPLDVQPVLHSDNNGEVITNNSSTTIVTSNSNNIIVEEIDDGINNNNNNEQKRIEEGTSLTDYNNLNTTTTISTSTTTTTITTATDESFANNENEKNEQEITLELEDLNVFATTDSSGKSNEEEFEFSNETLSIQLPESPEEMDKLNTETKVNEINTEMSRTECSKTQSLRQENSKTQIISTQSAHNDSNGNAEHDHNNYSNTSNSLPTVQQTQYYDDDINNNDNRNNATHHSNNFSHFDNMHDVGNEEIGIISSASLHGVPHLAVNSNLMSATSSLTTEKSNHSTSLSATNTNHSVNTNHSTVTTTATISLPSFASSVVFPLASHVLFASAVENHEVELHSFWESATNLSVPLYISNEESFILNKNNNSTANSVSNSYTNHNSSSSNSNSYSKKIKTGSQVSSNSCSTKTNENNGLIRKGRVAIIIHGRYFEKCIRHVHQITEKEYYQRMVIILKCVLEFIGDIFDKRACAFWYDIDPVSFSSFASKSMKDTQRAEILKSIALRKEFFTDEMNSGRSLPNVVSRLVGHLECKEGYTSTGEPSSVWVETGINVALATRLFELFDDHKQFEQIVLLCGDSNVYPSARLCSVLRKSKLEYMNTSPVRVCGTSSTISHLYGQQQDLTDFMSHILLDRMYHTENGKTIKFPTSAVFH